MLCVSSESFIEVSEEEEDADDFPVIAREERQAAGEETETEAKAEESSTEASAADVKSDEDEADTQSEEKELKEATETPSGSSPAVNEWEHMDMVCISITSIK